MSNYLPSVDLGPVRTVVSISAGEQHSRAVLDDGSLKCSGDNDYGQLGLRDAIDPGDNSGEMGDVLGAVELGGETSVCKVIAV